jgi:beta-glucanase (GH16 family)
MKKQMKRISTVIASVLCIGLVGCGESDLVEIHERELDDAIAALESPETSPANPVTDPEPTDVEGQQPNVDPGDVVTEGVSPDSSFSLDLSEYDLIFSEEFSSDSIDATKWNTVLSWGADFVIYNQLQYYVDSLNDPEFGYDPFTLDNGALTISAIETPENLRAAANEQAWLSGVLSSAGKFDLTYGYIEARVKVEQGLGLWPAFWLLSSDFGGLRPELFVMEYDGAKPDSVFHNYNYQDSNGDLRSVGQREVTSDGFSTGFHTVGVRWSEQELLFYIDGTPSYRVVGEEVPAQPMHLIINLAVGGIWPGAPDGTTPRPASMQIDYIRAYQLGN